MLVAITIAAVPALLALAWMLAENAISEHRHRATVAKNLHAQETATNEMIAHERRMRAISEQVAKNVAEHQRRELDKDSWKTPDSM